MKSKQATPGNLTEATPPVQTTAFPYIAPSLRSLAVPCASLTLDPVNARKHPARNLDAIKGSLRSFGQVKAIVVRQQTGVVVCGNGTLEVARSLGWSHIAANVIPLTDAQAAALAIADNRSGELAEWDQDALDHLLASVHVDDPDLKRMFAELQTTLPSPRGEDEIIDRADQLQKQWGTALGQLWVIPSHMAPPRKVLICPNCQAQQQAQQPRWGFPDRTIPVCCACCQEAFHAEPVAVPTVHKLLCADSTKLDNVRRLMAGEKANLFVTDPPYLVDYTGDRPNDSGKDWSHSYHEIDIHDAYAFYKAVFTNGLEIIADRVAIYCWHAHKRVGLIQQVWQELGILDHQQIVWIKPTPVFGRVFWHFKHEPCMMGWRQGSVPEHDGDQTLNSVWEFDYDGKGRVVGNNHPTQKPLEVFARPMRKHTRAGDVCYEPFAGSGSQLIAAEQLGRLCYACEIEPKFVAVALERLAGLGLTPSLSSF
jgi:DNA modification methylase